MISVGVIFQYDSSEGRGQIMLSNGEKKEFSTAEWADNENEPKIAQRIAYENINHRIKIRVAREEDEIAASSDAVDESPQEEESKSGTEIEQFDNVDDYISHYTDMGFKLVKDMQGEQSRTVSLRLYTPSDYGEAIIKQNGSKIGVTQTINGKTVVIS